MEEMIMSNLFKFRRYRKKQGEENDQASETNYR